MDETLSVFSAPSKLSALNTLPSIFSSTLALDVFSPLAGLDQLGKKYHPVTSHCLNTLTSHDHPVGLPRVAKGG